MFQNHTLQVSIYSGNNFIPPVVSKDEFLSQKNGYFYLEVAINDVMTESKELEDKNTNPGFFDELDFDCSVIKEENSLTMTLFWINSLKEKEKKTKLHTSSHKFSQEKLHCSLLANQELQFEDKFEIVGKEKTCKSTLKYSCELIILKNLKSSTAATTPDMKLESQVKNSVVDGSKNKRSSIVEFFKKKKTRSKSKFSPPASLRSKSIKTDFTTPGGETPPISKKKENILVFMKLNSDDYFSGVHLLSEDYQNFTSFLKFILKWLHEVKSFDCKSLVMVTSYDESKSSEIEIVDDNSLEKLVRDFVSLKVYINSGMSNFDFLLKKAYRLWFKNHIQFLLKIEFGKYLSELTTSFDELLELEKDKHKFNYDNFLVTMQELSNEILSYKKNILERIKYNVSELDFEIIMNQEYVEFSNVLKKSKFSKIYYEVVKGNIEFSKLKEVHLNFTNNKFLAAYSARVNPKFKKKKKDKQNDMSQIKNGLLNTKVVMKFEDFCTDNQISLVDNFDEMEEAVQFFMNYDKFHDVILQFNEFKFNCNYVFLSRCVSLRYKIRLLFHAPVPIKGEVVKYRIIDDKETKIEHYENILVVMNFIYGKSLLEEPWYCDNKRKFFFQILDVELLTKIASKIGLVDLLDYIRYLSDFKSNYDVKNLKEFENKIECLEKKNLQNIKDFIVSRLYQEVKRKTDTNSTNYQISSNGRESYWVHQEILFIRSKYFRENNLFVRGPERVLKKVMRHFYKDSIFSDDSEKLKKYSMNEYIQIYAIGKTLGDIKLAKEGLKRIGMLQSDSSSSLTVNQVEENELIMKNYELLKVDVSFISAFLISDNSKNLLNSLLKLNEVKAEEIETPKSDEIEKSYEKIDYFIDQTRTLQKKKQTCIQTLQKIKQVLEKEEEKIKKEIQFKTKEYGEFLKTFKPTYLEESTTSDTNLKSKIKEKLVEIEEILNTKKSNLNVLVKELHSISNRIKNCENKLSLINQINL